MTTIKRNEIQQQITDRVIADLEKGDIPWLKPWESGLNGLPHNALSKRRYNGINVLMLMWAAADKGYGSNEWLTLNQIGKSQGWIDDPKDYTNIVYFEPVNKRNDEGEEYTFWLTKVHRVYNMDQLSKKPQRFYKEVEMPDKVKENQLCKPLMSVLKADKTIKVGGDRAYYSPKQDYIQMPPMKAFHNKEGYQATLAHEVMHWTGHKDRLKRFDGHPDFSGTVRENYAFEELVAEMGAAFLVAEFGVTGELRHSAYIESWLKALKNDHRILAKACTKASQAVEFVHPDPAKVNPAFNDKQAA